jgi:hypothetical protein
VVGVEVGVWAGVRAVGKSDQVDPLEGDRLTGAEADQVGPQVLRGAGGLPGEGPGNRWGS